MSYTRLRYHIVTATQHREPVISPEIEEVIRTALYTKAKEQGARLLAVNGVSDHIHIVAAVPPTSTISDFVRQLKTASSRAVNKSALLEGEFHWQAGYGAFTLNPHDLSDILYYVAMQKEHHANNSLRPSYEKTS